MSFTVKLLLAWRVGTTWRRSLRRDRHAISFLKIILQITKIMLATASIGNSPNKRPYRISPLSPKGANSAINAAGINDQLSPILIAVGVIDMAIKKQNGPRQRHDC